IAAWDSGHTGLLADVPPSGSVTSLPITIVAPATASNYCLQYDLIHEGTTWFSWAGASMKTMTVSVTSPQYVVTWGAHTTPSTMTTGSSNPVTVSFTNAGSMTWDASGANPVVLSY